MLMRRSILLAATLLVAASHHARADDIPDLKGIWKGTVDSAVMVGSTPYRTAEGGKPYSFAKEAIDFTFDVKDQQGARFAGQMTAKDKTETLIGHLYPDHKSGMMLDDDGQYLFSLSAAGTMEVCYNHSKADSKVIACWTATKAP